LVIDLRCFLLRYRELIPGGRFRHGLGRDDVVAAQERCCWPAPLRYVPMDPALPGTIEASSVGDSWLAVRVDHREVRDAPCCYRWGRTRFRRGCAVRTRSRTRGARRARPRRSLGSSGAALQGNAPVGRQNGTNDVCSARWLRIEFGIRRPAAGGRVLREFRPADGRGAGNKSSNTRAAAQSDRRVR
jgi:hypothetical protein